MSLIDSHCHLDNPKFADDFDAVLSRATEAGVRRILSIGTGNGPDDMDCALKVARRYDNVFATAGVHPHDAAKANASSFEWLRELVKEEKFLAVGEIGLDYHYDFAPRDVQERVFLEQLSIAAETSKPVIIHTREAWTDTVKLLRGRVSRGVFHCFTGTVEEAEEAVALGFHLGFGGVLTFPKSDALREAARVVPADRIILETDAPYLAPVPHRGKRESLRRFAAVRSKT